MIAAAVSLANAASSSDSPLTSSLICQSASIESQLRFSDEDCRRPGRPGSTSPLTSAIVALSASVAENWAKLIIQ